jgi:carbon storage regulator CsrA
MLVLSRRKNESIVIPLGNNESITITVLDAKTRLGVTAPKSVRVLRGERSSKEVQSDVKPTTAEAG